MTPQELFRVDLDNVFARLKPDWRPLSGARLFITGGTGFIGRWMLEALRDANERLSLGAEAVILTRNIAAFSAKAPHLATYAPFTFVEGDVRDLKASGERFSHVIHASADASADLNENDPRAMFDTIVTGVRRVLDLAVEARAKRFFFLSSGAVYGAQPWKMDHVAEDYAGGPDLASHRSAYGEGKRAAEVLCAIYARQFGLDIVSARIFALLGPLLTLDIHFAAGNFISDALSGRTVRVTGAGRAVRSYLYAADLTVWLWKIALCADRGAIYNVGSEEAISIAELARRTATLLADGAFEVLGGADPGWNPGRYVPSTRKIRRELGVRAEVGLDDAILRTAISNGWKP